MSDKLSDTSLQYNHAPYFRAIMLTPDLAMRAKIHNFATSWTRLRTNIIMPPSHQGLEW